MTGLLYIIAAAVVALWVILDYRAYCGHLPKWIPQLIVLAISITALFVTLFK